MRPEQNGWHFADGILKWNFVDEKMVYFDWPWLIMMFVFVSPIYCKSALVQVKAWCQIGNKLYHEPVLTKFYDAMYCHQAAKS